VQPATVYLPRKMGEEGVVWSVCAFRLLPDISVFELWSSLCGAGSSVKMPSRRKEERCDGS
jgi:hypothetical protein